jgi:hypothetical protein
MDKEEEEEEKKKKKEKEEEEEEEEKESQITNKTELYEYTSNDCSQVRIENCQYDDGCDGLCRVDNEGPQLARREFTTLNYRMRRHASDTEKEKSIRKREKK